MQKQYDVAVIRADNAEQPFRREATDQLILDGFTEVLPIKFDILERWLGSYIKNESPIFSQPPIPKVVIGTSTSGKGVSIEFAFAKELLAQALTGKISAENT